MKRTTKLGILATVLGLTWSTGMAQAANLLGVVNTDGSYQAGKMSLITGSRVTTAVDFKARKDYVVDLNRDASLYPFVFKGNGMMGLRQYTYSTVDLAPTRFLDGNGDWNAPTYEGVTPSVANMHAAAGDNNYIYATGYDLGNLAVHKVQANGSVTEVFALDLKKVINEKCGDVLNSAAGVHGEALAIKDDMLFVTAAVNPYGGWGIYNNSYLLQFKIQADGSLEFVTYGRTAKNPNNNNICIYNNSIFTTGIGGSQGYGVNNPDSDLSHLELVGGKLKQVSGANPINVPEQVRSNGSDFRNMKILPDGTAYVLTYVLGSAGATSNTQVYKTTVSNLLAENPQDWDLLMDEGTNGYFNNIDVDYYTKRMYMECGNTVRIYTDGQEKPLIWTPEDLTNDKSFVNFNGWAMVPADQVAGEPVAGKNLSSTSITQKTLVQANYRNKITGTNQDNEDSTAKRNYSDATTNYKDYAFNGDKTIFTYSDLLGDLTTNVAATVDASKGNDINIKAGSNKLQLQSLNYVGNPTGIYAGNGKSVTVNAGRLDVLTIGAENGNSLTNGIWLDAPAKGSSNITINAPLNISLQGGFGGNGLAVQKTARWGESSMEAAASSTITVNGDVSILGKDSSTWGIGLNKENVFSRFNNAGILTAVNKSKVNINGNVDFTVYGNGVATNAVDSVVTINGGGSIVVPRGQDYGYYTLSAYQGTINMNMGNEGKEAGSAAVKLQGDIFALNTGTINLGLTTSDSFLQGKIDNGGYVNLNLQNGALWNNLANNYRYAEDNEDVGSGDVSLVNFLKGGNSESAAGIIRQTAASENINIKHYSGNAMVLYDHAADNSIVGGAVCIDQADKGSGIILRTDYADSMNTEASQVAVLNNLANKLYYIGYVQGEKNLQGKVEIAEGLTASSVAKYVGGVVYDAKTGQGSFDKKLEPIDPEEPEQELKYTTAVTVDGKALTVDGKLITPGALSVQGAKATLKGSADIKGAMTSRNGGNILVEKDAKVGGAAVADGGNITVKGNLQAGGVIKAENGGILIIEGNAKQGINMKNSIIARGKNSTVSLSLINKEATLMSSIFAEEQGKVELTLKNGAQWQGRTEGNLAINLENGRWINTCNKDTALTSIKGINAEVDMSRSKGTVTLAQFEGDATLFYSHNLNSSEIITGADCIVEKAALGSAITLQTDNTGIDITNKTQVNNVLNGLANKLYYMEAPIGGNNLQGTVKIAEGLTSEAASLITGTIAYGANGQGSYVAPKSTKMLLATKAVEPALEEQELSLSLVTPVLEGADSVAPAVAATLSAAKVVYGAQETAMMRGAKAVVATNAMLWRSEANDLQKRMGDVRLGAEEQGLWAKYYGGRNEMYTSQVGAKLNYKAYQLGYDKALGKSWLVGAAVSYNDGTGSMSGGRSEVKNTSLGVYGTMKQADGQYLDLIAKAGWLKNDFKVTNEGHKLEDSLKTSGLSLSAEYGKRFEAKNGFFFDPSVEMTWGCLQGKSFDAKSDYKDSAGNNKTLGIAQEDFNTLVGRLGFRIGKTSQRGSVYAKLTLAHEFCGGMDTTFSALGEPTKQTRVDFKDTWGELQLGGTLQLGRSGQLYADYQRSFAGDVKEKYRIDAGLRWSF